MARKQNALKVLLKLMSEAHDILRMTTLPEQRSQRAGWTVISMKNDWKTIFPPEKR